MLAFEYMKRLVCVHSVFGFLVENHAMFKEELQLLQSICGVCALFTVFEQVGEIEQYLGGLLMVVVRMWNRLQGIQKFEEDEGYGGRINYGEDEDLDEGGRELYESIFEEIKIKEVIKISMSKLSPWLSKLQLSPEDQQSILLITQ